MKSDIQHHLALKFTNLLWIGFILSGLLFSSGLTAQTIYSIDQVPNPKSKGQDYYVSDPDGILGSYTVSLLDSISLDIEKQTGAEYSIVLVNDYQSDDDFQFAFDLFNKWGIGNKQANNGLLLFIAKEKRQYRFISGYGMERIFPDIYLKQVGEKYLVPNFKEGNYEIGLLQASEFISKILKSPNSLEELKSMMPEAIPFFSFQNPYFKNSLLVIGFFLLLYIYIHLIGKRLKTDKQKLKPIAPFFYGLGCMGFLMFVSIFIFAFIFKNFEQVYQVKNTPYFLFVFWGLVLWMKIHDTQEAIKKSYVDEKEKGIALKKFAGLTLIPSILAPLALFNMGGILFRLNKYKHRYDPPDNSGDWERIVRTSKKAETSQYLNKGQIKEEKIGSRRYEIWKNNKSQEIKLIPWDVNKRLYECPDCHFFTLEKDKEKVIKKATYTSSGEGEKIDKCENCDYMIVLGTYIIPKLERSSGGSGSSSGGGGGSSGGGGSFGGGSSGGGGAGGRW